MIFTAVPMSAIGGIFALWLRDMPFSISAGVGFIALFGVAVLNGIVLISYFNRLRYEEGMTDIRQVTIQGSIDRLRPVLMTATVAAMGFLPMALSTSNGAEVQKPLATVVIGGLVTATLLTLVLLPVLYFLVSRAWPGNSKKLAATTTVVMFLVAGPLMAQPELPLDTALQHALRHHPSLRNAGLRVQLAGLSVDEARYTPPTQFELIAGQTNTKLFDYNFAVIQPLGNLGVKKQRRVLAEVNQELSQAEQQLLVYQVANEVKRAWYGWVYAAARRRQLEAQESLYRNLSQKSQLQFQSGEISGLEQTLADNQLVRIERELSDARIVEEQTHTELLRRAYLSGDHRPPGAPLPVLVMPDTTLINPLLMAPYQQQVEVSRQQTVVEQKTRAPELEFGYFNQSIRPDYALQGGIVRLKVPIFTTSQHARIEQSQLREIIAANELELVEQNLQYTRRQSLERVLALRRQLDQQGTQLQQQAARLRNLAEEQLNAGEVDYFRYLQSLEAALRSELDYIRIVDAYNQAVIDFEYFSVN